MFHLYDGDRFQKFNTLADAEHAAFAAIGNARDCCDPEWPSWVEEIAIYDAPENCKYPSEDGKLLLHTRMTNVRDAESGDGVHFWCDYEMAPPEPVAAE